MEPTQQSISPPTTNIALRSPKTTDRKDPAQPGCWTCRIRKKKCDEVFPVCGTCNELEINCYRDKSRPEWMHNGCRRQEMAQRIKAEVKRNRSRRRRRRKMQIIAQDVGKGSLDSSIHLNHDHDHDHDHEQVLPSSAGPETSSGTSHWSPPASTSSPSVNNDHAESKPASEILQSLSPSNKPELAFIMAYLDYVFPVSFPFYRPTILEGGRSWLLSSILENKCHYHTVISLTSYFFSAVKVNIGSGRQICDSYAWGALPNQTELALKKAQHDLHKSSRNGVLGNILESASLIGSVVQLVSVEATIGSNENWQTHLNAASVLFQQLLGSYSKNEPCSAFSRL